MNTELRVALARMEAKLDVALVQQADHEKRLRAMESKRLVTWGGLAAVIGGGIPITIAVRPLLNLLGLS